MENVVVAIITGVLAVLGAYVGNVTVSRKKSREDAIRDAKRDQKLSDRLDILEEKVDAHNEWGRKFGDYTATIQQIRTDIEWLKKSIEK